MDLSGVKYVVVGAGFFGSVIAERIANINKEKVVVLEKRDHIGGNCYSEDHKQTGIHYHKYGTHIFHTPHRHIWDYISKFTEFNGYYHQVLTTYKDKVYQMPINLETINSFYNVNLKPYEVSMFLEKEIQKEKIGTPKNFEEKAISMLGRPLYEAFFKGYTLKQWQKDPREMSESILKRLPFRTNYNESYYHSRWQGIPLNGYAAIFEKMLKHPLIDIKTGVDFFDIKNEIPEGVKVIYSGPIDQYFDYKYGTLEYRTLSFEEEIVPYEDFQGTSVMNYAEASVPYTRIHEPKHLHPERSYGPQSIVIREYSKLDDGSNPYYPINDDRNHQILLRYREEAARENDLFISGRLGEYRYYDMHDTIRRALELFEEHFKN
ncbi:MAG: UDP-galactopyranose mutase [Bacteroidota bacterium]